MDNTLYLDIETLPAQRPDILADIRQGCAADLEASIAAVKAPSNYGEDATAKWWASKGDAQVESLRLAHEDVVDAAYRKTSLDGAFGQVCVIGWAFGDDKPMVLAGMDEAVLLEEFSNVLKGHNLKVFDCTVVGHNVASFDLRFLTQRHIVCGIRPSPIIGRAASAKPWESDKVFDTMVQWAGPGGRVSLDKLCKALGIKSPKGDLTGANVWDYVKAGKLAEVATYCAADVDAVRQVHRRMTYQTAVVQVLEDVPA